MFVSQITVQSVTRIATDIYEMTLLAPDIAKIILPGQFLNIKVSDSLTPLLRRPFSVSDCCNEELSILFHVCGEGTMVLSQKKPGDKLDVIAPLGNGFRVDGDFTSAILVAGGIGVAPFPFLTKELQRSGKKVMTLYGSSTAAMICADKLLNTMIATDDGTSGFHGTVVALLEQTLPDYPRESTKVFVCGPHRMLAAAQELLMIANYETEISAEAAMACGFGICQGCPMPSSHQDDQFLLVCKDGPVFNAKDIRL